ncbi:MAG: hypothetical protein HY721_10050 [Planctomycetes bacterium]|nr:hypothetical protein [Planctomycetota bacterium]
MARIADLSLKHRLFLKAYKLRRLDPVPWAPLRRPLRECRVALVTTAAFYLPGTEPFDEALRGGDTSFRVLRVREPDGTSPPGLRDLRIGHRSSAFDPAGIVADHNLALPADRFLELEREGTVGRLHEEALSFMGSITTPGRLVKQTAPEAAALLVAAGVDAAFLTPV